MNLILILAAFCVGITSAASTLDGRVDAHWYQWKAKHSRPHGMNEEGWWRAAWENMKMNEYGHGSLGFTRAMNTGRLISVGEQNLVDCSWPQGNGGLTDYAFQYIKENGGLDSEESYPYDAKDESCKYTPEYSVANDTSFVDVPKEEKALMKAVATVAPIMLVLIQFYKDGIYFEPNCCSEDVDRGVLVVGYAYEEAELDNHKYWLVKNSWSEAWGISGYIKMAKDQRNHCGITKQPAIPLC
uniref:Peptidase C1A papain C-terminal domain-containing protein n=1 Tax=Otolemur garnettii TaxID=30611 RepID=H0XWL3_OTOGA